MRKIRLIIKREYLTRVKTRGFIIGTIIVPLIGLGSILLVVFLVGHTATQSLRMVIVDNSGSLAPAIVRQLDGKLADGQPQFAVEQVITHPAPPPMRFSRTSARASILENWMRICGCRRIPSIPPNCTRAIPIISASSDRSRMPWTSP